MDVTHTRTFFSSNKVSTGNGSTAGKCAGEVIYPETLWTIKKLAFTEVNLQGPAKAIWSWDLLTYITKRHQKDKQPDEYKKKALLRRTDFKDWKKKKIKCFQMPPYSQKGYHNGWICMFDFTEIYNLLLWPPESGFFFSPNTNLNP